MDPISGILLIALGSIGAASFYVPFKKVKSWAWESYWISQGFFAWIIIPWIFALIFIPKGELMTIIRESPASAKLMAAFFGLLWGFGGLTFGLALRYLGVALGQSIALGLCAAFGTLLPPIIAGDNLFATRGGILTLIGVAITVAGIIIIGYAGSLKSREMSEEEKKAAVKEFALKKGILIAIFAGIMSACFNFGYEAGKPIENIALAHGTNPLYQKNPSLIFILLGGFITNLVYCVFLNIKNKTYKDYYTVTGNVLANNLFFTFLAGLLWFLQFHFFGMGSSRLPAGMAIFGWSILMALNIAISNIWGIILSEWKGVSTKTIIVLVTGIIVLILSAFIVKLG
ncbi:MAG TPA: L-rhamnose/proton symporter RhaT [Bacteroidales bacterium]|jgi:L-rhamnose-H+ transport protein|nr:L-rhamnose/proton symporter RhaT [Bacteroidales bacterium]HOX75602.1 L-rhamnose/proton symporter RhaT [Bacteroidales bacterium]HPM86941.1 L-rhamnose/proton symporter RhaT [Bacteroidales bacterium]HQM67930.1 L-rhamnose/proton symporter RhaT [Bacteroidales bacterium]